MELDDQELEATKKMREKKCKYCDCENIKKLEEIKKDNIFCTIYGRFLRIQGKVFAINFGRTLKINYCPMCGRKLV